MSTPKLTQARFRLLRAIAVDQEENGIGYHLLFIAPSTERKVRTLEGLGLVDATTDPRYAALTEAGRKALGARS